MRRGEDEQLIVNGDSPGKKNAWGSELGSISGDVREEGSVD